MNKALILISILCLTLVSEIASAQFTGGIGRGDSMARLDGIITDPPAVITLNLPQTGPQTNTITIPQTGNGYIYFVMAGDVPELPDYTSFTIDIINETNSVSRAANAVLLENNLIAIRIPHDFLDGGSVVNFRIADQFVIGDKAFTLGGQNMDLIAQSIEQQWKRSWNLFSRGSAGASAIYGVNSFNVSPAMAKKSVSGAGGVSLELAFDPDDKLFISRSFDAELRNRLQAPAVNLVIDRLNPEIGENSSFITKVMNGQTFSFSDHGLDPDIAKAAEAGLILETLSLAGIAMSPITGVFLAATVEYINSSGNLYQNYMPAWISSYIGTGIDGGSGLDARLDMGLDTITLTEGTVSGRFAFSGRYVTHHHSDLPEAEGNNSNNETGSEFDLSLAYNFNPELLNWEIRSLNTDSLDGFFPGNPIVVDGLGFESGFQLLRDRSNSLQSIGFYLSGGNSNDFFTGTRNSYTATYFNVPGTYVTSVPNPSPDIIALVHPAQSVRVGTEMINSANEFFNDLIDVIEEEPVTISTFTRMGKGEKYKYGFPFDFSRGVGFGFTMGAEFGLFDEIEYLGQVTQVYNGGASFTLHESGYQAYMEQHNLEVLMYVLFSAAVPLIENEFLELVNRITEQVTAGSGIAIEGPGSYKDRISGGVTGSLNSTGEVVLNIFSPKKATVVEKAFELPIINNIYTSNSVGVRGNNIIKGDVPEIINAESEVIIISEVVDVRFIPDATSEEVDELDEPVTIFLLVYEDDLQDSGFSLDDRSAVDIYHYLKESNSWLRMNATSSGDSLKVLSALMGEYALGIEINRQQDTTPPLILEYQPETGSSSAVFPEIYAVIEDDRYGSGIDFTNTFILLNGDTLAYSYFPAENKISYRAPDNLPLNGGQYTALIFVSDFAGNVTVQEIVFTYTTTTNEETDKALQYELAQNYPNPFNPQTIIPFTVPEQTHVQINIYDMLGRHVATLLNDTVVAGRHEVIWNTLQSGRNLSSGVYFYQLKTSEYNEVKKLMLVK